MKNKRVNIKIVIIIVLIGIIITLIGKNLNNKKTNIEKKIEYAEQLTELTSDNAYISMEAHLSEISNNSGKKVEKLVENYLCNSSNKTAGSGGYGKTMTHTFDVTSIDSYDTLTEDNFIIEIVKIQTGANADDKYSSLEVSKAYDAITGQLVVSNLGYVWNQVTNNGFCSVYSTVNIWVVR